MDKLAAILERLVSFLVDYLSGILGLDDEAAEA